MTIRALLLLLVLLLSPACRKPPAPPGQRYPVKGKVVEVLPDKQLTLDHEDIPGYMQAMTMTFPVKDEALMKVVSVGDQVTGLLVIEDSRYWLQDLVVTRKAPEGATPPPPRKAAAPETKPGEPVPDVTLVTQDGRKVRLADYRGRAVALTFIYTRCPLPDYCPLMTKNFMAVAAALAQEPALLGRTHLLSVSFDPEHDTPEVLKRYGRNFAGTGDAAFSHWEFASGPTEELRRLGDALGLEFDSDKDMWVHNLRTAIIAPDGRLVRSIRGNDWKPEEVVADLRRVSAKGK